jgi:hypothetical protein
MVSIGKLGFSNSRMGTRLLKGMRHLKNTSPHTTKGSLVSPMKIISD